MSANPINTIEKGYAWDIVMTREYKLKIQEVFLLLENVISLPFPVRSHRPS